MLCPLVLCGTDYIMALQRDGKREKYTEKWSVIVHIAPSTFTSYIVLKNMPVALCRDGKRENAALFVKYTEKWSAIVHIYIAPSTFTSEFEKHAGGTLQKWRERETDSERESGF